ncbi:hypothetical protein L596_016778 [Steinernema carpocapsae]|uniref:TIL domain-containing protein n=1 Tax=Steinernema carpocapsae TaxID=34508 RepID=A0A4U5NKG7_STECR|nr:hypothetical protein L596_016778 [Steinernema carpocapsae]
MRLIIALTLVVLLGLSDLSSASSLPFSNAAGSVPPWFCTGKPDGYRWFGKNCSMEFMCQGEQAFARPFDCDYECICVEQVTCNQGFEVPLDGSKCQPIQSPKA